MIPALRAGSALLLSGLASGCIYIKSPVVTVGETSEQSAEQVLGAYLLLSAMHGDASDSLPALAALYPPRAQLVTYGLIAFHREHEAWPVDAPQLQAYLQSSPANAPLPPDSLDGFEISVMADGSCAYSTREDRQRGRRFIITASHQVRFPVPASPYAGPNAADHSATTGSSIITIDAATLARLLFR